MIAAVVAGTAMVGCTSSPHDEVVTYGGDAAPVDDAAPLAANPSGVPGHAHPASPADAPEEQPPQTSSPGAPLATVADDDPSFVTATRRGAGSLARTYLQPAPARRIVIDVLAQSGAAPRADTIDHLASTLGSVARKQVVDGGRWTIPHDRQVWSAEAINETVDELSRADHERDSVVLHIVFLRGSFDGSESVLGVATRADTFAVFVDQVEKAATALVDRGHIEAAVATHELGHLLGLVDLVLQTRRSDPEHPGHSSNRRSVMYWAVESGLVTQVLSGGPPRDFDDDDLADLAAIRNGE